MKHILMVLALFLSCVACRTVSLDPGHAVEVTATSYDGAVSRGTGSVVAVTDLGYYVLTAGHVVGVGPWDLPKFRHSFAVDGTPAEYIASYIGGLDAGPVDPNHIDCALLFIRGGHTDSVPRRIDPEAIQDGWFVIVQTRLGPKYGRRNDNGTLDVSPRVTYGDSGSAVTHNGDLVGLIYAMNMPEQDEALFVSGKTILAFLKDKIK